MKNIELAKTSKHWKITTGSKNRKSLFKRQKNFLSFSNLAESGEESENLTGNMADFRQGLYNIHNTYGIIQYT